MKKKILSLMLTLTMLMSLMASMAITASAQEADFWRTVSPLMNGVTDIYFGISSDYSTEISQITNVYTDHELSYYLDGSTLYVVNTKDDKIELPSFDQTGFFRDVTKVVFKNSVASPDCSQMFYECSRLESIDLSGLDTSNVTDMSRMFAGCSNLSSLDVSSFDTSNVTNMSNMFADCEFDELDLSSFDTSNVTNMSAMFARNYGISELDLSSFDTSSVTDMGGMFNCCENLSSLDLSSFDTTNVTNMSGIFERCIFLDELDLSSFDTRNVTDMSNMFMKCAICELDLSNFDTSNVTNMSCMFKESSLGELDISSFDTSSVTDMGGMFNYCGDLSSLELSSFDTTNVVNMSGMFFDCHCLEKIIVCDEFVTTNVTASTDMFVGCGMLVGENETPYSDMHTDAEYARIDAEGTPGYLSSGSILIRYDTDENGNTLTGKRTGLEWDIITVKPKFNGLYKVKRMYYYYTSEPNNKYDIVEDSEGVFAFELGCESVRVGAEFEAVTPKFANTTTDSGYYSPKPDSDDSQKSGIIAFTSAFNNLIEDFRNYRFVNTDLFGIAMFGSVTDADNKSSLDLSISKTKYKKLKAADGYFYSFISSIDSKNFGDNAYAMPFAVIGGQTYWGNIVSAKVFDKDGNAKWLGNK